MIKTQICPHCRSVFEVNGQLDFGAKAIQVVNCPVCGQEIWIPSGLWPQQWTVGKIIKREYNPAPPIIVSPPPASETKPVWSNFSITHLFDNFGQGVYKIGIWAVVILVLVFLISREWKK